jgi:chromosome segregation ATPase|tara:strand:+ start:41 stop:424 length:384 start_codon:yes stop_codon:yes gene_type:complete
MRVAISYAVDLEEIPEEVENLLRDVQWDLEEKLEEIISQVRERNFSQLGSDIIKLRNNLNRVDTRLEDCYNILVGYVRVLNKLSEEMSEATSSEKEHPPQGVDPVVTQVAPGHKIISAPPNEDVLND